MSVHQKLRGSVPLALALAMIIHHPAAVRAQGIRPHIPVSTTVGDIGKLRAAYVDAYNARDAKAMGAMYTADAIAVGLDGSATIGAHAIAKMLVDSAANAALAVNSSSVKVYGTTAIDVGTWTVHPNAGGEIVSRYLIVLRHGVTGWRFQNLAVVPLAR